MAPSIIIIGLISIAAAFALAIVLYRLATAQTDLPPTTAWISELSLDRYRPMLQLLSDEDLQLVAATSNQDRKCLHLSRAERCALFRTYLQSMTEDFTRICTALKILLLQAQEDRPDLAVQLLQQRIQFQLVLLTLHGQLWLYRWNVMTPDVKSLFRVFDSMRVELVRMVPATNLVGD